MVYNRIIGSLTLIIPIKDKKMNQKSKKIAELVEIVPVSNSELKIRATAKLAEQILEELKLADPQEGEDEDSAEL